jgi:hypothetical protein
VYRGSVRVLDGFCGRRWPSKLQVGTHNAAASYTGKKVEQARSFDYHLGPTEREGGDGVAAGGCVCGSIFEPILIEKVKIMQKRQSRLKKPKPYLIMTMPAVKIVALELPAELRQGIFTETVRIPFVITVSRQVSLAALDPLLIHIAPNGRIEHAKPLYQLVSTLFKSLGASLSSALNLSIGWSICPKVRVVGAS